MRIIAIDPGLDGVGIACFIDGKLAAAEGKVFKSEKISLPRGIPEGTRSSRAWIKRIRREKPFDQRLLKITDWLLDRANALIYLNWVSGIPITNKYGVIEVPPPFTYGRTGDRNQWEIAQLRMLTGMIMARLSLDGYVVEGIYPLGWKGQESAEATVRRVKQAVVLGAIPATPGLSINKTPPDIWTSIGICWSVTSRLESEKRAQ